MGVDPRIPIKPHQSEYRARRRQLGVGFDGWLGGGLGVLVALSRGPEWGSRPLNSCKLITINQALFFDLAEGWLNSAGANPFFTPPPNPFHLKAIVSAPFMIVPKKTILALLDRFKLFSIHLLFSQIRSGKKIFKL